MRYVMITYHMEKIDPELGTATDSAETCIRLPMRPALAEQVLNKREKRLPFEVVLTLVHIAELQGYRYTGAVMVEEVLLYGQQ